MTPANNVNPSFCASLYQTGASSVNWLSQNAKTLSASAGETLGKMWAAVSTFFSSIAQTLGQWMNVAQASLVAAKDHFVALPRDTKIIAAVTLAATAALAWVTSKVLNKAPAEDKPVVAKEAGKPAEEATVATKAAEKPAEEATVATKAEAPAEKPAETIKT